MSSTNTRADLHFDETVEPLARPTTPEVDAILGVPIRLLDHGFVRLVDYMGNDAAIVQAARVSYGKGTKKRSEDAGLIRYLMRHRHCYHPSMEVLTVEGWKRWEECNESETFLVPDPTSRNLQKEKLPVERFPAAEELVTFKNQRMSFAVTGDHRMWFRKKQFRGVKVKPDFAIHRANIMPRWGHFDPLRGYSLVEPEGDLDPVFQFVGFYLGDGSYGSRNRISFHLRKPRELNYLRDLLSKLDYSYTEKPSTTYPDAVYFWVHTPDSLKAYTNYGARCKEKAFNLPLLDELSPAAIRGLFDGLAKSDGSIKKDRQQIQFNVQSPALERLFMALSAMMGYDAHLNDIGCTAFTGQARTSLEARKEYFGSAEHIGEVFCATTSTGLLMVRGGPADFAFVCGNTSPFEMVDTKFHIKAPIFVARQWLRHRTASVNEVSARYSLLPEELYIPEDAQISFQSTDNKQGRSTTEVPPEVKTRVRELLMAGQRESYASYQELIDAEIARELARIALPVSIYTEWYWKLNLHNLFHFLSLRMDAHAQYEIRIYAEAIGLIVQRIAPVAYQAFLDYMRESTSLSGPERTLVTKALHGEPVTADDWTRISKRERTEFARKFGLDIPELPPATPKSTAMNGNGHGG